MPPSPSTVVSSRSSLLCYLYVPRLHALPFSPSLYPPVSLFRFLCVPFFLCFKASAPLFFFVLTPPHPIHVFASFFLFLSLSLSLSQDSKALSFLHHFTSSSLCFDSPVSLLSSFFVYLFPLFFVYLYFYPSLCLSIYLSFYPSIHLFIYQPIHVFIYLSMFFSPPIPLPFLFLSHRHERRCSKNKEKRQQQPQQPILSA